MRKSGKGVNKVTSSIFARPFKFSYIQHMWQLREKSFIYNIDLHHQSGISKPIYFIEN